MAGMDATTGKLLDGVDHVVQSVEKIFTTSLGSRIMREWFGNPGVRLLGENPTERTILRWWAVTWACLEIFEPRFRVKTFQLLDANRLGGINIRLVGEYRLLAHLDFVQAELFVSPSDGGVSIVRAT